MNRLKRLWHNFTALLPEYERRSRQEWLYWGTRRAERSMRAFACGSINNQKPASQEDRKDSKGQEVLPDDTKGPRQ